MAVNEVNVCVRPNGAMPDPTAVKEESKTMRERSERQLGWCEPPPMRSREKKGPTFFYMIPLERWNTEHRFDSTAKGYLVTTVLSALIGPDGNMM